MIIVRFIDEGLPITTTIKKNSVEHWIVIYGVGLASQEVFIAGNNFPWSVLRTTMSWSDFKKKLPSVQDWLVCSGK